MSCAASGYICAMCKFLP